MRLKMNVFSGSRNTPSNLEFTDSTVGRSWKLLTEILSPSRASLIEPPRVSPGKGVNYELINEVT